ncbi:hypothetical protein OQA88_1184 [Cercophora sp. LCS_1]
MRFTLPTLLSILSLATALPQVPSLTTAPIPLPTAPDLGPLNPTILTGTLSPTENNITWGPSVAYYGSSTSGAITAIIGLEQRGNYTFDITAAAIDPGCYSYSLVCATRGSDDRAYFFAGGGGKIGNGCPPACDTLFVRQEHPALVQFWEGIRTGDRKMYCEGGISSGNADLEGTVGRVKEFVEGVGVVKEWIGLFWGVN